MDITSFTTIRSNVEAYRCAKQRDCRRFQTTTSSREERRRNITKSETRFPRCWHQNLRELSLCSSSRSRSDWAVLVDTISREHRSWNMGKIRSRDTKPERLVRSLLHHLGFRFRLHRNNLPGKPDIVLPKWKHVVFVHGCFWHRHADCKFSYTPKSRVEFWTAKFAGNVKRDRTNMLKLEALGWTVSVVWECQLSNPGRVEMDLEKSIKGPRKQ